MPMQKCICPFSNMEMVNMQKKTEDELNSLMAMAEDIEEFRKYVENENDYRVLNYIIKNVEAMRMDIPVLSCIFHKCEEGRIESSEDDPIDSDKVNGLAIAAKNK